MVEVLPRGDAALLFDPFAALGASPFALVDLAAGAIEPVERLPPERAFLTFMQSVAFVRDGSQLLYFVPAVPRSVAATLVVRNAAGDAEQTLLALGHRARSTWVVPGRGRAWAADGAVFVQTGDDAGLLLRLGGGGEASPKAG